MWSRDFCFLLAASVGLAGGLTDCPAEDRLPADRSPAHVIDHYIAARLATVEIDAAPTIDDAAFLRRLTLDLAGRVPTIQELQDFLALPTESRRAVVIDAWLEQIDFAFHRANEIDLLLLAQIKNDSDWRSYLFEAAKENRSWSKIFQEVMTPELQRPGEVGPAAFLRERVRELDDLTNDTAVLFFGVNIGCAKCHDHPLVADWEQQHYYGMASFFKRTYQTKSRLLGEDIQGRVQFTDILGEEQQAEFMFLSNVSVEEPETPIADDERKSLAEQIQKARKEQDHPAPVVPFQPRAELVRLALESDEKQFLARNIVNRTWARLIGRGLVMPLDQMHSANPPSHPELMDWLVGDLIAHDYDLKRLIRGIVSSDVYARSPRWNAETPPPSPDLFAVGVVRPLTPRQLSLSLHVATASPQRLPGLTKSEDWTQQRTDLEQRSEGFANLFTIPQAGFQVGTDEALLFSNSERFENEFLSASGQKLVGALRDQETVEEQISLAFRSVLSRDPTKLEQQLFEQHLQDRQERIDEGLQQIVWALLASPEFRFNH